MKHKDSSDYEVLCQIDTFYTDIDGFHCLLRTTGPFGGFQDLNELKPYLRSMSNITEEERKEYTSYCFEQPFLQKDKTPNLGSVPMCIDWLNQHHFDYYGLIEKGLALEALEDMYQIK